MDKNIIKMLKDPEKMCPLQLIENDDDRKHKKAYLFSPGTGKHFRIVNGIPVLLNNENLSGLNLKYQKFYDRIAHTYNLLNRIYYFLRHGVNYRSEEFHRRYILEDIEISTSDKVLEVAIGPGSNLRFLPKGAEYYGVDISFGMLNSCRQNLKKWGLDAHLFQAMAECLPFMDNIFDIAYLVGGFNYFNNREKTLKEMIRVVKPGGKIIIIDETLKSEEAAYKKVPVMNKIYSQRGATFTLPLDLIPKNAEDVKVKEFYNGVLYSLSFRVPLKLSNNV